MDDGPPPKRAKIRDSPPGSADVRQRRTAFLDSLSRAVSPPRLNSTLKSLGEGRKHANTVSAKKDIDHEASTKGHANYNSAELKMSYSSNGREASTLGLTGAKSHVLPSPTQLSRIADLPASENKDTVSLHDILGDPLIREAWIFNFCFDVDWLMQYFDPDVRDMVQVNIVHGSWRREDTNKIAIDDACNRRSNVKTIQAYLPDAFGTHHSKMFVLFRHDDHAQVIIHTANMLAKDWTNMTQAIWKSPLLPLELSSTTNKPEPAVQGIQFKNDLIRYLKAYGGKLKPLVKQIQGYDFGSVRATLVASAPSKFKVSATNDEVWGHEMLRRKLGEVPLPANVATSKPHFVFQVSSIASLPSTWLQETLYSACNAKRESTSIIFPTATDVAMSLDGYAAGGSIHLKAQKPAHLKQISEMRSQLCRWLCSPNTSAQAGRGLAAPHIKTYIRFASKPSKINPTPDIDWALVTSANLSTHAWGSAAKLPKGEKNQREAVIHIQSYEIGVLVWPGLYNTTERMSNTDAHTHARMVPTFKQDIPDVQVQDNQILVGFRMPYDLPLTSYTDNELPWSPQSSYDIPDRHGRLWE